MTETRFSKSILSKVFYPNGVKSEKYLLKNFVSVETGKTVKQFRSDSEEPLNKLPIKEIDTQSKFYENSQKKCLKSCKNRGWIVIFFCMVS